MRQIAITVEPKAAEQAAQTAKESGGSIFAEIDAHQGDAPCRLLIVGSPNARVEYLFDALDALEPLRAGFPAERHPLTETAIG